MIQHAISAPHQSVIHFVLHWVTLDGVSAFVFCAVVGEVEGFLLGIVEEDWEEREGLEGSAGTGWLGLMESVVLSAGKTFTGCA